MEKQNHTSKCKGPVCQTKVVDNANQPILDNQFEDNKGLTKREYFAGLAMQEFIAYGLKFGPAHIFFEACAADAVKMSDALLAELDKPKN